MNYYTADLHFGHKNILSFTNRNEYTSVEEMDTLILDTINNTVNKEDTLYILGDVALGGFTNATTLLGKIKCKVLIVPGNHDTLKALTKYEKLSNVSILKELHETKLAGKKVVLCHYPLAEWNGYFRGSYHLYGHTHANFENRGKSLDVGWDNYHKIYGEVGIFSEEQIIDILKDK